MWRSADFHPQDHHGGRAETTPASCPPIVTSTQCHGSTPPPLPAQPIPTENTQVNVKIIMTHFKAVFRLPWLNFKEPLLYLHAVVRNNTDPLLNFLWWLHPLKLCHSTSQPSYWCDPFFHGYTLSSCLSSKSVTMETTNPASIPVHLSFQNNVAEMKLWGM